MRNEQIEEILLCATLHFWNIPSPLFSSFIPSGSLISLPQGDLFWTWRLPQISYMSAQHIFPSGTHHSFNLVTSVLLIIRCTCLPPSWKLWPVLPSMVSLVLGFRVIFFSRAQYLIQGLVYDRQTFYYWDVPLSSTHGTLKRFAKVGCESINIQWGTPI